MENQYDIPDEWKERYRQTVEELIEDHRIKSLVNHLAALEIADRIEMEEFFGLQVAEDAKSRFYLKGRKVCFIFEVPVYPIDEGETTLCGFRVQALHK